MEYTVIDPEKCSWDSVNNGILSVKFDFFHS